MEKSLQALAARGVIGNEGGRYSIVEAMPAAQIQQVFSGKKERHADVMRILESYHQKEMNAFYKDSFSLFNSKLESMDFEGAQKLYDIFSCLYCAIKNNIHNQSTCLDFIHASTLFLKITQNFTWCMRRTHVWCMKCRALATAIQEDDALFVINTIHIFICITNYSLKIHTFHSLILRKDKRSQNFNKVNCGAYLQIECFFAFLAGYYNKAITCAYDNIYAEYNEHRQQFGRVLHSYSAFSAMLLGEYDVALDILNNGLLSAKRLKLIVYVTLFQSFIAFILLLKNDDAKAYDMLLAILRDNKNSVHIGGVVWANRLMAYYHYKNGNIAQSYVVYKDLQSRVENIGFLHGSYLTASFVLELLTEYDLSGYPSPSKHSIDEEINILLQSPAPYLRACALRCRARILTARQNGHAAALTDIQEALRIFRELRTPVELSKTLNVCIELLLYRQNDAEAIALIRENISIARRYGFNMLSPVIQNFIDNNKSKIWLEQTRVEQASGKHDAACIYHSDTMHDLYNKVSVLADKDATVFIFGESGVGKEHIARSLHEKSRRKGSFVAVNLSSIPEQLFESEFFGYERGAFTGAMNRKAGLLELADNGTLFLDEVADISPHIQVKLLRILQEKEFMRVGGTRLLRSEFRVVAASNKNLEQTVRDGLFREDLFYRINVVSLLVPPLRERETDIIFISEYYLNYFLKLYHCPPRKFSYDDISFFMSYSWPGNVRELRNYVERFVLSFSTGAMEGVRPAPASEDGGAKQVRGRQEDSLPSTARQISKRRNIFMRYGLDFWQEELPSLEEIKNQYIEFVYCQKNGKVSGPDSTERILKVGKVTAYRWIEKLHLRERYVTRLHGVEDVQNEEWD